MEKNVGGRERKIRIVLGAFLAVLGVSGYVGLIPLAGFLPQALTSIALILIGVVLFLTGYLQRCMVNRLLGIDSSEKSD